MGDEEGREKKRLERTDGIAMPCTGLLATPKRRDVGMDLECGKKSLAFGPQVHLVFPSPLTLGRTVTPRIRVGGGTTAADEAQQTSGNAYFHLDVYDDQERERRQFVLGLYELLKNDGVTLQCTRQCRPGKPARPWQRCGLTHPRAVCARLVAPTRRSRIQRSPVPGRPLHRSRSCASTARTMSLQAPTAQSQAPKKSASPSRSGRSA